MLVFWAEFIFHSVTVHYSRLGTMIAGLVIPASLELMLGLLRIDNHAIQKLDEIPLGLETDS